MVGEANEVKMHVFDTVLFENALVFYQLRQIQIVQSTVLARELQIIQGRDTVWVSLVIMHTIILDDILHHADTSLVRAHVQSLLVGCHQVHRSCDATNLLSASLRSAAGHVTVLVYDLQLVDLIRDASLFLGVARLRLVPRQLVALALRGGMLLLESDILAGIATHRVVLAPLALRSIARLI